MKSGKLVTILLILAGLGLITSALLAEKFGLFGNGDNGYIHINHLEENWKFYLENEAEKISPRNPDVKAPAGLRQILVYAENYWPWFKQVHVDAGKTTEVSPFLVSKIPEVEIINSRDPEYESLFALADKKTLPDKNNPLISDDGKTAIWAEKNGVYAKWQSGNDLPPYFCLEQCKETIKIFESNKSLKNLAFWENRNDVVMISVENGIYAFEIDLSSTQNFEPVFQGKDPTFFKSYDGSLYIADNGTLIRILPQ